MKFVSHRRGRTTGRAQDAKRQARDVLHRSRAGALILGLAAAAAVAVPATASASTGAAPAGASAVVGHVYVNDNTKGTNTIGAFIPIPGSTVTLAANAAPADVLFNGTGSKLAGTEVGTSVIDSFTVGFDGRLTAAPGSPFPAQGLGPFGSEFRPTNPGQLFVSNAHNVGAGTGTVSAYTDSFNGVLTPIGASPFADDQTAPCWVEITHDGQFLFTVNTGSGEISRYRIAPDGTLTLLGSTPVAATGGVGAVDARLSPDGRFLYVDESRIGKVGAFAVNGGNLTELATSPFALPAGATPAGIAVN